ncbi:MAG TPA: DNA repair protein RadA [Gammaproteobacteria bacterium]|nr:DNA repair protein RadA [Gammaproteobacteria bacterium]
MARQRTYYVCEACGAQAPRWSGQCADCGAWNTLMETRPVAVRPGAKAAPKTGYAGEVDTARLNEVRAEGETARTATGLEEFDRVLGGGLVAGSVSLIGGDPGIGKSTLLLQVMAALAGQQTVLYVTGEESLTQVALRAERLGLADSDINLAAETRVEAVLELVARDRPAVLVLDSIQTIYTESLSSAPGSVSQLRESTALLVRHAKQIGTTVLLVGHVTKQGAIAGPRVLEHMVDTVLYFENDAGSRYRAIRAVKNRFGAANELGVFAMTEHGLKEVRNPSAIFLARDTQPSAGSVVSVVREGTRPLLIEVQALVDESPLSNPRRVAVGCDPNRLGMLLAVLHRHGGRALYGHDVFINVVGGLKIAETGLDLALALALASSLADRPLPEDLVVFGEVGLGGEVRPVYGGEERLAEAAKQGFKQAIVPSANLPRGRKLAGLDIRPARTLSEALAAI